MAEQAQTVALPKRLPLVIDPSNREESPRYDARLVNCYMETKGEETWIYPRPGVDEFQQPSGGAAVGRGMFNWNGNVYSIFGNRLYKDGVVVAGTVNASGRYRFDSCLGSTPKLQLGNGSKAYNYDDSNGLVEITDGDFPSTFVLGWAYLNGTSYVMRPTDAGIQGDDINTPTAWDPLNVILAQIAPEQGVALAKQLVYAIAFKQTIGEVFYDAGNSSGSPLGRNEGAMFNWGCIHARSVRYMDGALIWLGRSRDGPPEVVVLNNLKADVVSTKAVERLLQGVTLTDVESFTFKQNGHRFYVLCFPTDNLSLAFDFDEKRWSQWTDAAGTGESPYIDACLGTSGQVLVQHVSDGKIYEMSSEFATDDGTEFPVDIYTPNFDGGTQRNKTMGRLSLITDQRVGAKMKVQHNDNDYDSLSWTTFRELDLNQSKPYLSDMGTFVRRAHHFHYKSSVRMPRIQAVEMQLDIGTL